MKNAYRKEIPLAEIADQVDSEYIEEAHELHPYDDKNIMIDETGAILDGFHRAAGIIAYTKENEQDSDCCYVDVIVVTHSNTIGIVADRNHRLHTKLVGLVANRV